MQYVDDPNAEIEADRERVAQELEDGELTDEQAEAENEELDRLQGTSDEGGRPAWADDADDPENHGEQLG